MYIYAWVDTASVCAFFADAGWEDAGCGEPSTSRWSYARDGARGRGDYLKAEMVPLFGYLRDEFFGTCDRSEVVSLRPRATLRKQVAELVGSAIVYTHALYLTYTTVRAHLPTDVLPVLPIFSTEALGAVPLLCGDLAPDLYPGFSGLD